MTIKDIDILDEIAKIKGFKSRKKVERVGRDIIIHDISPKAAWAEYYAKELGFEGRQKGEKVNNKIVERYMSPISEFKEYILKKTGSVPDNIYVALIPSEEITEGLRIMEQKWLDKHQKFIEFCKELVENVYRYYNEHNTNVAAIGMEQLLNSLEEYHKTHPGSMNIYSKDELILGFDYCLPGSGIRATVSNKKFIIFEAIST